MKSLMNWVKENWLESLCSVLMLLGIIIAFFTSLSGGILVGLSIGLSFSEEMRLFFTKTQDFYKAQGLFNTLMLIGGALFLFISVPTFVIATVIGFAIMTIAKRQKTENQ